MARRLHHIWRKVHYDIKEWQVQIAIAHAQRVNTMAFKERIWFVRLMLRYDILFCHKNDIAMTTKKRYPVLVFKTDKSWQLKNELCMAIPKNGMLFSKMIELRCIRLKIERFIQHLNSLYVTSFSFDCRYKLRLLKFLPCEERER